MLNIGAWKSLIWIDHQYLFLRQVPPSRIDDCFRSINSTPSVPPVITDTILTTFLSTWRLLFFVALLMWGKTRTPFDLNLGSNILAVSRVHRSWISISRLKWLYRGITKSIYIRVLLWKHKPNTFDDCPNKMNRIVWLRTWKCMPAPKICFINWRHNTIGLCPISSN